MTPLIPLQDRFLIEALEKRLGHRFRDPRLLVTALTHRSWANENPKSGRADNEKLEFLGDAVLDLVIGHMLMDKYPDLREGQLSVTRAQVVSEAGLSEVAVAMDLGAWLFLGKGEDKSGGREKPSLLSDALEAKVCTDSSGSVCPDPNLADTDNDGISDYDELNYGDGDPSTYTPGTDLNPDAADTDGDGVNDGIEQTTGHDPLDAGEIN